MILDSVGARTQPCFTPFDTSKLSDGSNGYLTFVGEKVKAVGRGVGLMTPSLPEGHRNICPLDHKPQKQNVFYNVHHNSEALRILEVNMNTFYCSSNYVEVFEGSTTLRGPICISNDYTAKYQAYKSSRLTVKYRGTYEGYRGFRAVYFIRNNSAVLTETTGYIASPGYPLNYKANSKYLWLITARPGQVITMRPRLDQDSQNYDKSSMTCKQTLNMGEQCDPTMEDMCASRDFVCRRQTLNTTMYTCQQACTSESIDKKTFIALIVVVAVGWAVAILAVVLVIILCLRNEKRSAPYRGGIVIREATEARSNDYRTCPPRVAQDSLQNGNKEEQNATTPGQSTLTVQTTNTAQPAVPATDALENKPVVPARPPVPPKNALGVKQPEASSTPTFINTSFELDSKDEDGIIYGNN